MTSCDLIPTSDRLNVVTIRFSDIENLGVDTMFSELAAFAEDFEASARRRGGR